MRLGITLFDFPPKVNIPAHISQKEPRHTCDGVLLCPPTSALPLVHARKPLSELGLYIPHGGVDNVGGHQPLPLRSKTPAGPCRWRRATRSAHSGTLTLLCELGTVAQLQDLTLQLVQQLVHRLLSGRISASRSRFRLVRWHGHQPNSSAHKHGLVCMTGPTACLGTSRDSRQCHPFHEPDDMRPRAIPTHLEERV